MNTISTSDADTKHSTVVVETGHAVVTDAAVVGQQAEIFKTTAGTMETEVRYSDSEEVATHKFLNLCLQLGWE